LNTCLYIAQGFSYAGVFIFQNTKFGEEITENIFSVLWWSNFILPFIALLSYGYITFRYAGFPFIDSISKERHVKMSRLFAAWSLCRVLSGLSLALSASKAWTQNKKGTYVQMYVVAVAILTEGIPVMMVLNWSFVRLLEREQHSFTYQALQAEWQESLISGGKSSTVREDSIEPSWKFIDWQEIQLEKS